MDILTEADELVAPTTSRKLSETACIRCRTQKLKCSRKTPGCSRCYQRGVACHYPNPPDRKHLAARRGRRASAPGPENGDLENREFRRAPRVGRRCDEVDRAFSTTSTASPISAASQAHAGEPTLTENSGQRRQGSTLPCIAPAVKDRTSESRLPELEVGLFLVEIYFTRIFSSCLLFDQTAFVKDYRASRIPDYVLLAMFAMASLLFRPDFFSPFSKQTGLAPFADLNKQGRAWAEAASRLVLTHADQPSLFKIQTCEMLGLYWFGVGDLDRVAMHSGISREMSHILQRKARLQQNATVTQDVNKLGVPLRTRYACWIKNCLIDSSSWCLKCRENLPELQSNDLYVVAGSEGDSPFDPSITHSASSDWLTWDEANLQSSTVYCVKLLDLWRKVKVLVRSSDTHSTEYLTAMFGLDAKLQKLHTELPLELKAEGLLRSDSSERITLNAFFLRSIYYLCLVYLHASLVPGLSGSERGLDCSRNLADYCARTALLNATLFSGMAKDYLSSRPDFSKVPTFCGYCAFIIGSTHAVMLSHVEESHAFSSFSNSVHCLLILQELKEYWPILSFLSLDLKNRIGFAKGNRTSLSESIVHELILQSHESPASTNGTSVPPPSEMLFALPSYPQKSFILRPYIPCGDEQENGIAVWDDQADLNTNGIQSPGQQMGSHSSNANLVAGPARSNYSAIDKPGNVDAFTELQSPYLHGSAGLSSAFDSGVDSMNNGNYVRNIQPENLHNLWDIFGGTEWDQLYPDIDQTCQ